MRPLRAHGAVGRKAAHDELRRGVEWRRVAFDVEVGDHGLPFQSEGEHVVVWVIVRREPGVRRKLPLDDHEGAADVRRPELDRRIDLSEADHLRIRRDAGQAHGVGGDAVQIKILVVVAGVVDLLRIRGGRGQEVVPGQRAAAGR